MSIVLRHGGRYRLIFALISLLTLLSAIPLSASQPNRQTIIYPPSTENFPNPERGFYGAGVPLWLDEQRYIQHPAALAALRAEGITLVRWYFLIDEFRTSDLTPDALVFISEQFDNARIAGVKVIPRFAYNFPMDYPATDPDAELAVVLRHIAQLRPVLRANSDVIAFMETGFVGLWGEWHGSSNHLIDNNGRRINQASRRIIRALLDALPPNRMIAMRYAPFKQQLYGDRPVTRAESFTGIPKARMGAHNDCFLSNSTDSGTYPDDQGGRDALRRYLNRDNRFVVQGGETCSDADPARVACASALADLALLRFSTLNNTYHPGVLQAWQTQGCYDEIAMRLGYRFRMIQATLPLRARAGNTMDIRLTLQNDGFASPYNPRAVQVILRSVDSGATYRLRLNQTPDPRRWLPDRGPITVNLSGTIPRATPPGYYEVLLNLPDRAQTLRHRPEYSIRMASAGVWEEATGYNSLLATVQIRPAR